MSCNVVVNLSVNANASGTIDIFGQTAPVATNYLIADYKIPASSLYTPATSNGLFSFVGSNGNLDGITGNFNATFAPYSVGTLMTNISNVIAGSMNCSNAAPYSDAKYAHAYDTQANFGYVALGTYAHTLFGHVAATAAIDNDTTFVANMIGNAAGVPAHAKIATLLNSNIATTDPTAIVKQVIGQDASRARLVDNDGYTPVTSTQGLQFIAGDVIFMNVTLNAPTVTVASGASAQQYTTAATSAAAGFTSQNYPIKITLS